MKKEEILKTAKKAALAGGKILLRGRETHSDTRISLKGFGDWVTDIDHEAEETIINSILEDFPEHKIIAEESGEQQGDSECEWIIDPLDGTANFVKGIPVVTVSIAFAYKGGLHTGIVYDPVHDELFSAQAGQGAYLNGSPVHVAQGASLNTAVIATGFPWRSKPYIEDYLKAFGQVLKSTAGARRLGSAALDLAYTACGRVDGFWEMQLKPWDISAGVLLVQEAGGVVTDFRGGPAFLKSGNLVAAPQEVHEFLVGITTETLAHIPGQNSK